MGASDLAGQSFWQDYWSERLAWPLAEFQFGPLLDRFLAGRGGQTVLELGCVPGDNLVHMVRRYGLRPFGIDYLARAESICKPRMSRFGVDDAVILEGDVFEYRPSTGYDVVFSMGLVEHFSNPDPILAKHTDLAKTGGLVVIALPNFRHFHFLARLIADRPCLKAHSLELMKPSRLGGRLKHLPVEPLFCGYHGDFAFWLEDRRVDRFSVMRRKAVRKVADQVARVFRHRPLRGRSSAIFSPWVVFVGRKLP